MKTFNFGIIGAARIANKFCDAVKMIDNAKVIAVASNTSGKAKNFAEENGLENYYDSYEEMLQNDDIDGVYISTTHNFHYDNAMLCLKYNKPFICEKCFVLTKSQAVEVFDLAKSKNLFSMEAMWSRYLPTINKAKEWIDSGKIGEISLATLLIGFRGDKSPGSRMYEPSLAGGAIFDIGVYAIEIITYLMNDPILDVKAFTTKATTGVDEVDSILLKFDNSIASINCTIASSVDGGLTIYGTNGTIVIKNPHHSDSCTFTDLNGIVEEFNSPLGNGFEYEIKDFIQGVTSGKLESDVIPHKDTIKCAEIFDICLK